MSTATAGPVDLETSRLAYLWTGEIVHVGPPAIPHSTIVHALAELLRVIFPPDAFMVWTEQPILLREGYRPYPDILVIRGTKDTRGLRPLSPEDPVMLVEVCDTTVANDLVKKPPEYAATGIPPYWVVLGRNQQILAFANPVVDRYEAVLESSRGEAVPVRDTAIAVDDLFRWMDPEDGPGDSP